jgi:hypothetical protein
MPMAMKILAIAQNRDILCYSTIHGGGYEKIDNCPTLRYIALFHYLWRWLLALDSKV